MFQRLKPQRLMTFSVTSFISPRTPTRDSITSVSSTLSELPGSIGPFPISRVLIELSTKFNRRPHPDLDNKIETIWQEYKQKSPSLFNGTKFRLDHWSYRDNRLVLHCGLTDYRTYLGTCTSDLVTRLCQDGALLKNINEFGYLSRKIGVSAVIETSDKHIVLLERSQNVGIYQHLMDTPGGHPEPSAIPLTEEALLELDLPGREDEKVRVETAALRLFFGSIVAEVYEETNISSSNLSEPLLLGIVNQAAAHTPSFTFYMKTTLSATQVLETYQAGPQDKFESTQLKLINIKDLFSSNLVLTPAAQGSLQLYQMYTS